MQAVSYHWGLAEWQEDIVGDMPAAVQVVVDNQALVGVSLERLRDRGQTVVVAAECLGILCLDRRLAGDRVLAVNIRQFAERDRPLYNYRVTSPSYSFILLSYKACCFNVSLAS